MNNELYQWQFKNGNNTLEFTTFPLAFRTMFNLVKQGIEDKKPVNTSGFIILGPKDQRGDRVKYNYDAACEFARNSDLLNSDGYLNGKVFKKKF